MRNELRTKSGRLTAYAFACGYVEEHKNVVLSMEHGTYLVRRSEIGGTIIGSNKLKDARRIAAGIRRNPKIKV